MTVVADPIAGSELVDLSALEAAGMPEVDILQTGRLFESGELKPRGQGAIFFPDPLSLYHHGQSVVEAQVGAVRLLPLLLPSIGQAVEFHGVEFFHGLFGQHLYLPGG